MHFDQFIAVQKEKIYFFTTHPIFSIVSPCTLSNENYWKVNSIFQIHHSLFITLLFGSKPISVLAIQTMLYRERNVMVI